MRRFFEALDLERGELVNVKSAVHKKAWPAACETLVAYYREGNLSVWLRNQPVEIENER
ncbi:MAG: heparinase II/III family protein [bacterium]